MHLLTVDGDDALGRIDDHGTEIKNLLVLGILGDDLGAFHAAQQRLAAGDELTHGERLGHVIVSTGTQANDLVGFIVTGGEDQHRNRALGNDTLSGFKTIHNRQHDIHDDQIGLELQGGLNGGSAISSHTGGPSFSSDALGDGSGERRLVLHYQHRARSRVLTRCGIQHE